jgi:lipopolysaccharide/colanic/teichoic acid biosynthesis glycosyltransferase
MTTGELPWMRELSSSRSVTRSDVTKRVFDAVGAAVLLIVFAPLLLTVFLLVRLTSPGAGIYRHSRVGRNGRPFVMYKFRTMRVDTNDDIHRAYVRRLLTEDEPPAGGARGLYKLESDPRITRVGRLLRRTSIDELPQLVNVVQGRMSLVGPRPAMPWEAELFPAQYWRRFLLRPGVTGLWQVSGRSRLTMRAGLDLDLEYLRRQSLLLDVTILLKTVATVFRTDEAS